MELRRGHKLEWRRLVTEEDIKRFADISGDRGAHHLYRDAQGRIMAHGLLVASLPTKLGGDLNFIARTMRFEFLGPVYGGDELTCLGVVDSVVAQSSRLKVGFSFTVTNQKGEVVMKGASFGMIPRTPA